VIALLPLQALAFDLAAAINSAAPGATIEVPVGNHRGPFVIDKPLRLLGASGAVLEGDGKTNVVEIRAPDVELAGFVIRKSGGDLARDQAGVFVAAPRATIRDNQIVDCLHGVYLKATSDVRVLRNVIRGRAEIETVADPIVSGLKLSSDELCSAELEQNQRGNGIHLWKSVRIEITDNDIRGTRDGIYFSFADQTTVRNNRISRVRYGLHYMYSDENVFEGNTFTDNAAGAALMFSADITLRGNYFTANRAQRSYGLLLHTVDRALIENNRVEGNTVGLYLESNNSNRVLGNHVAGNYIGLRISESSADNTFAGNAFVRNVHPVEMAGTSENNRWSAEGRGNHWDGALALDLNRDGIADLTHREVDLFGPWRRDFPAIGLLSGSPGDRLIRFVYSRVPVRGLLGITDPRPLVRAASP
jgi:nitrous oxidase accessory protein